MRGLLFSWCVVLSCSVAVCQTTVKMSKDELRDKIKGGWAAQTIGCTFGGPTEFRYQGTMIQDYTEVVWYDGYMKWYYDNSPGLYDDIYMDLTFVDVFEKEGLDAPVESFAKAYANAEYSLWHANQMGRYNILNGIMPPQSGHWLNNPHADDIDYQIESDFAGLMSPGLVNTASEISDKIGHIMNYGDGWYGGVYLGAMYALAFVSDDMEYVVKEALKVIPQESRYYKVIQDAIAAYDKEPDDWKYAWYTIQKNWSDDIGCPDGVHSTFNIDASINSAWVVVGLLYGKKDFGKTLSISTRCGDDSDCNPASAGGILGTMIGFKNIPEYWKQGLDDVEDMDFKYTTISLNDVYEMGYNQALANLKRNGATVDGDTIAIPAQTPKAVRFEQCFEGHYPYKRDRLNLHIKAEAEFEFEGIGFSTTGESRNLNDADDVVLEAEMYIDGKLVETSKLPTHFVKRKDVPFWRYQLPQGKHKVRIKILNPSKDAEIYLDRIIIYDDKPHPPKH